jgi:hypothetical protein
MPLTTSEFVTAATTKGVEIDATIPLFGDERRSGADPFD